jgi:hypothetical protein
MKDSRGHGSNSHYLTPSGRSVIPSRPYREGTAHQTAIAEQHGVGTNHLVGGFRKVVSDAVAAGAKLHANSLAGYDPRKGR